MMRTPVSWVSKVAVVLTIGVGAMIAAAPQQKPSSRPGKPAMTARQVWASAAVWGGGQWSAAVSPDGHHLAYSGKGVLSVGDLLTGENRRLTAPGSWWDMDRPSNPVFSPDGELVAYRCDNCANSGRAELRVIALDGSAPRVLYRSSEGASLQPFDWSLDGKQILGLARAKSGTLQIVLWSVADGQARVLRTLGWGSPQKMSLSRDGRYVVYDLPARADFADRDIFLLGTDGGREVRLVTQADDRAPVWTPDGRGVLFLSARAGSVGAWFLRVVDGKPQGSPELVKQDVGGIVPIGFTPDGSFYYSLSPGKNELLMATLDPTSGAVAAQPTPLATQRLVTDGGRWSPDGQYFSYGSQRPSVQGKVSAPVIVIRSVATGEERELAPALSNIFFNGAWSPDGRSFIVAGTDKAGRAGDFYRVDARTGETTPILYENFCCPMWFLKGKAIVLIREGSGGESVVFRDLETGHETEMYRGSARSLLGPCGGSVSPDGQRLAVCVRDPETRSMAVMVLTAGETPRELGPRVRYPEFIDDILALTPDGRQVLYTTFDRESALWAHKVWRIGIEGGAPQEIQLPMERLGYVDVVSFHPDGRRIAFVSRPNSKEVWAMENFLSALRGAK